MARHGAPSVDGYLAAEVELADITIALQTLTRRRSLVPERFRVLRLRRCHRRRGAHSPVRRGEYTRIAGRRQDCAARCYHCRMGSQLASRCERIDVRGLQYNVRHWGPEDAPRLFMLHGWMDTSASFQFVVDALESEWHVIAPDWRGFGASQWLNQPYWFADYYGDLDRLLDHYAPDSPALLVGHSMGASIASIYAGVRRPRVARVVMLDFLGLLPSKPSDAPARIAGWLDALNDPPHMRGYPDAEALARRLMLADPRLGRKRAAFLAQNGSRVRSDGGLEVACDAWHRIASPYLYHVEEVMACWQAVEVPVLMLLADRGYVRERFADMAEDYQRRIACFRDLKIVHVTDAGHNLHHDQPEQVAAAIEPFLLAG